ncbi:MAG: hypothetical protein CMF41_05015 [Legionellales bacterium]|nr:hypothetical protein [Legionellales bacterium]OUX64711.1 MAG: hypothetical protein CBE41_02670 [Gammaproteobacteria bacterium TMED281]|tara:strand:+ start:481 stop:936 length:456 start_codon:yes stop_codon:yes gene_type:complete
MNIRFIFSLFLLVVFNGCGFHLVNVENYSLNIDKINPASERQIFSSFANASGFNISHKGKYVIKDLKYNVKYIANRNTGNVWRQYNADASWVLEINNEKIKIAASELINLSSNQSPNEMTFSNLYNPLRRKLLDFTHLEIRKREIESAAKN